MPSLEVLSTGDIIAAVEKAGAEIGHLSTAQTRASAQLGAISQKATEHTSRFEELTLKANKLDAGQQETVKLVRELVAMETESAKSYAQMAVTLKSILDQFNTYLGKLLDTNTDLVTRSSGKRQVDWGYIIVIGFQWIALLALVVYITKINIGVSGVGGSLSVTLPVQTQSLQVLPQVTAEATKASP